MESPTSPCGGTRSMQLQIILMMAGPCTGGEADMRREHGGMPTRCGGGGHAAGGGGHASDEGGNKSPEGGATATDGLWTTVRHKKLVGAVASKAKQKRRPKQSPSNTCHQCRQQSTDFPRDCKGYRTKGRKGPCTLRYCGRCLLNRYGKEEELAPMEGWICPKCRGICNCSVCRKKKGEMPTGALAHVAKAIGCTSVHDLLQKSPETMAAVQVLRSSSPKQSQKRDKRTNVSAVEFQDQGPKNMGADFIVPRKKRTKRSYTLNNNSVDKRSPLLREGSPNGPYNTNVLPLTNSYPSPHIGAHVEDKGNIYEADGAAYIYNDGSL